MASLKDIRARIESTKNTQKITRAMKMVSAAKLRRAQQAIVNLRPYAVKLQGAISDIAQTQRVSHPLLTVTNEPKKVLLVVLTSDRGLCGGFNNNINKYAWNFYRENKGKFADLDFLIIGRKAADFFRRRDVMPLDTMMGLAKDISFPLAAGVAERLINHFSTGEYDAIYLVYNEFKSAISQNVVQERLLPIDLTSSNFGEGENKEKFSEDLIFEPEPEAMIEELLKHHFTVHVYRAMCESVAAEHGARMAAMENATKNAGEMIRSLTLTYNKLRQASITTELIEITSGAEALKG